MKLVISTSTKKDKKLMAEFFDGGDKKVKTIHFGLRGSTTYLDTGDKKLREAYRARHKKVYDKSPPMSASRLSYEIIWGDSQDLNKNVASYKKKYGFK